MHMDLLTLTGTVTVPPELESGGCFTPLQEKLLSEGTPVRKPPSGSLIEQTSPPDAVIQPGAAQLSVLACVSPVSIPHPRRCWGRLPTFLGNNTETQTNVF